MIESIEDKVLIEIKSTNTHNQESFIYLVDRCRVNKVREAEEEFSDDLDKFCKIIESLGAEQVDIYKTYKIHY